MWPILSGHNNTNETFPNSPLFPRDLSCDRGASPQLERNGVGHTVGGVSSSVVGDNRPQGGARAEGSVSSSARGANSPQGAQAEDVSSSARGDNNLFVVRTEGGASSSSSARGDNSVSSSAQGGDRRSPSTPGDRGRLSQQGGQADGTVIPLALQEKRGGAAQGGLIPREQLAIDGTVRPSALQEKMLSFERFIN